MLVHCAFLIAAIAHGPTQDAPKDERRAAVRDEYRELAGRRDADGLRALWAANRGLILQTIDEDLERGLALWEESPEKPDAKRIGDLHQRALFAAIAASEATGHPIFADYAASFVGWGDQERRNFRAGQAVYKRALKELEAGEHDVAVTAAQETYQRAMSLGDWWGAAMGRAAEGRALQGGGHLDAAVVAFASARVLYRDLGLEWNELQNVRAMAELLRALERWARAHVALNDALELARKFADQGIVRELLAARAEVERKLGREEDAAATQAELDALKDGDGEPR